MKKKALKKDFLEEIKKSRTRFFSILFIVAMGVAMFAGIHASAPDMRYTSDAYYDRTNLMDLRVVGTLGITQEDLAALANLEGTEAVEGGYMTDVLCKESESQNVLHVESLLENMNQPELQEGRMPQNSGECFLDQAYMEKWGYQIGDVLELSLPESKETETEEEPILSVTRYTIVGSGDSSVYVSFERGSSSVGNGDIAGFVYILPEDFNSEVYMAAYLTVEGASQTVAYTEEYEQLVEEILKKAEGIQEIRCEIRYQDVKDQAQERLEEHKEDLEEGESELEKARKEWEDGKAEAESELEKAKKELQNGESELEEGKQTLLEKETELRDAKQQIVDGEAQLAEKEGQLASARKELAAGETKLNAAEKTLQEKQKEYDASAPAAQKQLEEGQKQLEASQLQMDSEKIRLESEGKALEDAAQKSSEAEAALTASQESYRSEEAALASEETEYTAQKEDLDTASANYDLKKAEQEQAQEAFLQKQQEQEHSKQSYLVKVEELRGKWETYQTKSADYELQMKSCEEKEVKLQELMLQKNTAETVASEKRSTAEALKGQNSALKEETAALTGEITDLESRSQGLQTEISSLQSQKGELEKSLNQETEKGELASKETVENLKQQISEIDSRISAKTAELQSVQQNLAQKKDTLSGKEQLISENAAQISSAEAEAQIKEAEAAALGETITPLSEEVSAWKIRLESDRKALQTDKESLDAEQAQLDAEQAALDQSQTNLEQTKTQLDADRIALESEKKELDSQQSALTAVREALDAKGTALEQRKQTLEEQWAEWNLGKSQIVSGKTAWETGKAQLEAGQKELETKRQEITAGLAQLLSGGDQLREAWKEINSNRTKLVFSKKQLEDGSAQLEAGKQTLLDSKTQLISGEQQIEDAWSEIEENEQSLKEGWQEYEDGKKEVESELSEGEEKIKEAESEMEEAREMLADAQKEIEEIEQPQWYVNDRAVNPEYSGYGENAERIRNIGKVFPVMFFLVAALISLTTMTRMVEEQRTQIGTLKALGYSKVSIASKYLKYAFYATLGGSIAGILIGEKLFPYIIVWAYGMMYPKLSSPVIPYNWEYGLMAAGAAMVCTLGATFASCYKELAATPAVLMRPPAPKEGKRVLLEYVPFLWKRLNFTWKSTIRNLFRYKKRFFMTIAGIGGCMALLLLGFGLKDSIVGIGDLQYGQIQKYDMMAVFDNGTLEKEKEELDAYLMEKIGNTAYKKAQIQTITVTDGKKEYSPYLYVPENTDHLEEFLVFRDRISHETYELQEDGAIVTEKLASMLGVKEGDDLVISEEEKGRITVPIAHIAENYLAHYVYLTPALYEKIYGEAVDYNGILLTVPSGSQAEMQEISEYLLNTEGALNVTYSHSISEQLSSQLESMDLIIWVLIICAGMLAYVVLYNLNNININERKRELATLKVLGFYHSEVAAYVYRENILLTAIGALVGLGMGTLLHRFVIVTVEVDSCMFGRQIQPISFIYGILLTFLFSAIVNGFMYFKLKRIDMVESLKSIE